MDESLKRYTDAIGEQFGTLFYHSYHDIVHLRDNWRVYEAFFGDSEERVDLLNSASPFMSWMIQRTLFDATLMGIRRITDKRTGKRQKDINITINNFSDMFTEGPDKDHLRKIVQKANSDAKHVRDQVDLRIAHSDFDARTGAIAIPLVSRSMISQSILSIEHVLKWVGARKLDTSLSTFSVRRAEDEFWFLRVLFEGQRSIEAKKQELSRLIRTGKYPEIETLQAVPDWLIDLSRRDKEEIF